MSETAPTGEQGEGLPSGIFELPAAVAGSWLEENPLLARVTAGQNAARRRTTKFEIRQSALHSYVVRTGSPLAPGSLLPPDVPLLRLCERAADLCVRFGELRRAEGDPDFADFEGAALTTAQKGKVNGDLFDLLIAGTIWDAIASWNARLVEPEWLAVLCKLERDFPAVSLIGGASAELLDDMRMNLLHHHDVDLPSSSPDMLIVRVPLRLAASLPYAPESPLRGEALAAQVLTDIEGDEGQPDEGGSDAAELGDPSGSPPLLQTTRACSGRLAPDDLLLGIASKSSLRSDRQYQPIMEAMILQMLVEGVLGARRLDFDVFAGDVEGADAESAYRAVSLHSLLSPAFKPVHRAVRELYLVGSADEVQTRIHSYLDDRRRETARPGHVSLAWTSAGSPTSEPPSASAVLEQPRGGSSALALFFNSGEPQDASSSREVRSERGERARRRLLRRADRRVSLTGPWPTLSFRVTGKSKVRVTLDCAPEHQETVDAAIASGEASVEAIVHVVKKGRNPGVPRPLRIPFALSEEAEGLQPWTFRTADYPGPDGPAQDERMSTVTVRFLWGGVELAQEHSLR